MFSFAALPEDVRPCTPSAGARRARSTKCGARSSLRAGRQRACSRSGHSVEDVQVHITLMQRESPNTAASHGLRRCALFSSAFGAVWMNVTTYPTAATAQGRQIECRTKTEHDAPQ